MSKDPKGNAEELGLIRQLADERGKRGAVAKKCLSDSRVKKLKAQ